MAKLLLVCSCFYFNFQLSLANSMPTFAHLVSLNSSHIHHAALNEMNGFMHDAKPVYYLALSYKEKVIQVAESMHNTGSILSDLMSNLSMDCTRDVTQTLEDLIGQQKWSVDLLDAFGKPGPDLMQVNLHWFGSYRECLDVRGLNSTDNSTVFHGQYCTVHVHIRPQSLQNPIPLEVQEGVCVPDSCSQGDVTSLFSAAFRVLDLNYPVTVTCQEDSVPFDLLAVLTIVVLSVFAVLMLAGTSVDICRRSGLTFRSFLTVSLVHDARLAENDVDMLLLTAAPSVEVAEPGLLTRLLVSFSVYTNGIKLLSTEKSSGSLGCVHGIRFLSMAWVVLGHTYLTPVTESTNLFAFALHAVPHWTFQTVINASFSVDTFFTLSGLLVSYLSMRALRNRTVSYCKFWLKFYFHRFWRLTPLYMLVILVYVGLGRHFGHGPAWRMHLADRDNCRTQWWANLFYVNNFIDYNKMCLGQSWYLSNDMQFYIISPLILICFHWSWFYGTVVVSVALMVSVVTPAVLTMKYHFPPGLFAQVNASRVDGASSFDILYNKPYNRIGPYVIGMVTGYVLHRADCKFKVNRLVNLVIWSVMAAASLAVLYGLYHCYQGNAMNLHVSALYNSISRPIWALAVSWVVFACVTGNGGFVNTILSWNTLVPISRLTYSIYLIHTLILSTYILSRETPFFFNDVNVVMLYLGVLVVCYLLGFVVSLAVEAPMLALEKIVFGHR